MKDEDIVPLQNDSFPFFFFFFSDFRFFFFCAYGGLHRRSPHVKKAAKIGFGSQRKQKKKVTEKTMKHNLTNYSKFFFLF